MMADFYAAAPVVIVEDQWEMLFRRPPFGQQ